MGLLIRLGLWPFVTKERKVNQNTVVNIDTEF